MSDTLKRQYEETLRENARLTARVKELEAIRGEYRNRLKQFGAEDGSLDAAEQDAIARAALSPAQPAPEKGEK